VTLPSKYRRPISSSNLYWILGISAIITAVVVALYLYYTYVPFEPVQKDLNIESEAMRKFVHSKKGETLEYLTTGPTFTQFDFYCDGTNWGFLRFFSPSLTCLKVFYDGKPGIVEFYIERNFLPITQVAYDGALTNNWPIPYQILRENTNSTKIRIELPSSDDFSGFVISNADRGSLLPYFDAWTAFLLGVGTFVSTFIGSVFLVANIRDKF
jgi:hypothetical protein